jgi:hypothetical protein
MLIGVLSSLFVRRGPSRRSGSQNPLQAQCLETVPLSVRISGIEQRTHWEDPVKRILAPLSAVALATLTLGVAAPASASEVVRTIEKTYPAQNLDELRFEMSIGAVKVQASDRSDIHVSIELRCRSSRRIDRCRDAAQNVRLREDRDSDRLDLDLSQKGPRRSSVEVITTIEAPRGIELNLDLGIGEISVAGFENDINVDLGIGEASVNVPESAFRTVRLDTGIGESDLIAGGRHIESSGLFTDEITWNKGRGQAAVYIDCGIGEARVRLEGDKKAAR